MFLPMATATQPAAGPAPASPPKPRDWAPRIWEGCNFFAWMRLLLRNRCRVSWTHAYIAVIITCVSVLHTLLHWCEEAIFGRAIRRTKFPQPPIFILGHWRTGTTLLHELLIQDPRHAYPTTYECLAPNHFLLTESFVTRWLYFLAPSRRPMDNMKAGFERPQEDEFGLCMLGALSPYLTVAFPNNPPQCQEYLDLEGVAPSALRRWQRTLMQFLKRITYKSGKRLVLKSPPHTARLKVLRDMFPGAAYIHIVRDPYVVYPSTVKLWKAMYQKHGLQKPTFAGLEELVLSTFVRLYERLEEGRKLLDPRQFYELRYEELIADPEGEVRKIYEHFGWGGFDEALPRLRAYWAGVSGYETNKHQLTAEERARVSERWGEVIRRYRYDVP
jgi:hypothetical protein